MAIAMKDLEIRGAGNLLGGEQSGPHRRRRLRPLRPAGRRGGRRVQGRRRGGAPEVRIELPVDAHLRTTTSPASGCGSRCTSGWPRCATDADVDEVRDELRRPLRRRRPSPWRRCSRGALPGPGRQAGVRRSRRRQVRPVRAGRPARVARRTARPAAPEERRQGAGQHDPRAAAADRRRRGAADHRDRPA